MGEQTKIDKKYIESVVSKSSDLGLLSLYIARVANERKIAFSLDDILKHLKIEAEKEYIWGFLVACNSFSVIEFTSNRGIYNVSGYNNDLSAAVISETSKRLESTKVRHFFTKDVVKLVDEYFN